MKVYFEYLLISLNHTAGVFFLLFLPSKKGNGCARISKEGQWYISHLKCMHMYIRLCKLNNDYYGNILHTADAMPITYF